MTQRETHLLAACTAALNANPFADPVYVEGRRISRAAARADERRLLRLRSAGRLAA